MSEEKDLGKIELKPADYCAVIFVLERVEKLRFSELIRNFNQELLELYS